ncbi:hypothetical protein ALC53_03528 [Atta colombica]|uniref:Uncharacterized protein n=1 Tax=Atta colombica TaxID=520822 RepID=A0A195BPG3_9HYME|nr:hypothetical protein ALC53_03528 [Atta colombica]
MKLARQNDVRSATYSDSAQLRRFSNAVDGLSEISSSQRGRDQTKRESGAKHDCASLDEDQQVAWTSGGDRCLYVVGEEGVDVVAWRGYSGRLE